MSVYHPALLACSAACCSTQVEDGGAQEALVGSLVLATLRLLERAVGALEGTALGGEKAAEESTDIYRGLVHELLQEYRLRCCGGLPATHAHVHERDHEHGKEQHEHELGHEHELSTCIEVAIVQAVLLVASLQLVAQQHIAALVQLERYHDRSHAREGAIDRTSIAWQWFWFWARAGVVHRLVQAGSQLATLQELEFSRTATTHVLPIERLLAQLPAVSPRPLAQHWLLSDFDLTISEIDTSFVVPESAANQLESFGRLDEAAAQRERWSAAVTRYFQSYERQLKSRLMQQPQQPQQLPPLDGAASQLPNESLASFFERLDRFEVEMLRPVLDEALLRGASLTAIDRHALERVPLRAGAVATLRRIAVHNRSITQRSSAASDDQPLDHALRLAVVSVNWSQQVVCGLLDNAALEAQPIDVSTISSSCELGLRGIPVLCNRIEFTHDLASDTMLSSGNLSLRQVTSSADKLVVARRLLEAADRTLEREAVYIGDSPSDLPLLLQVAIGIVIDGAAAARAASLTLEASTPSNLSLSSLLGRLCSLYDISVLPLLSAAIERHLAPEPRRQSEFARPSDRLFLPCSLLLPESLVFDAGAPSTIPEPEAADWSWVEIAAFVLGYREALDVAHTVNAKRASK